MGVERRHHLVSRGFQRAWTADGKRLHLVDIEQRTAKLVGTRDAFWAKHLLTVLTQEGPTSTAEQSFGRVESAALPNVRRFVEHGDRDEMAEASVRALVALQWARSGSLTGMMRRILRESMDDFVEELEGDEGLGKLYLAHYGRTPDKDDVRRELQISGQAMTDANEFFVDRILHHYNVARAMFSALYSQRVTMTRPGRVDLVFADSPVIVMGGKVGTATQVIPLKQADTLWCPLSPEVAVSLSTEPIEDLVITPIGAQLLNQDTLRYAQRYLGAHPRTDLDLALQKQPGTYRVPC